MSETTETSELPRYYQVSNILAKRIEEGAYQVGSLLPTEIELCKEFDISRHTVREALRRLTEAGLVRRRQGSGTQIIATQSNANYVHAMRSLSELFQYASDTVLTLDLLDERAPAPEHARHFGDRADEEWIYFEGLRTDRDAKTPICFTRVYIDRRFAGISDELRDHAGAIYALIERRYKVTVEDVEQEIRAVPIARSAAKRLGVNSRDMAVQVVRRYMGGDGRLILVSINEHPSERFSYTMHLRREGSKGFS
ncbi:GntR family transcriptional regulator [Neoaquamicrobium sediminum]|uniref:GntR family transcriptional regulator n=1 Tax=Neoaquamicrobium sediminum TaxID=1849104 RepID=UPI003BAA3C03